MPEYIVYMFRNCKTFGNLVVFEHLMGVLFLISAESEFTLVYIATNGCFQKFVLAAIP